MPALKRGRKVLPREEFIERVKKYISALRNTVTPMVSSVMMAAAEAMRRAYDRTLLVQHGGHIY